MLEVLPVLLAQLRRDRLQKDIDETVSLEDVPHLLDGDPVGRRPVGELPNREDDSQKFSPRPDHLSHDLKEAGGWCSSTQGWVGGWNHKPRRSERGEGC